MTGLHTNSTMKIHTLMLQAQRLFNERGLKKKRSALGFNARGIDDLLELASSIFAEVGITTSVDSKLLSTSVIDTPSGKQTYSVTMRMEVKFTNPEDSSFVVMSGEGWYVGSDPSKVGGSATSYLYKDILFKGFCIPVSGNHDPDFDKEDDVVSSVQPVNGLAKKKII